MPEDGRRLYYFKEESLWMQPLDGGEPEEACLPPPGSRDLTVWNEKVVYWRNEPGRAPAFELFDLATGKAAAWRSSTKMPRSISVSTSPPDGRWIVFSGRVADADLVLVEGLGS